jgi:hypothetical protein
VTAQLRANDEARVDGETAERTYKSRGPETEERLMIPGRSRSQAEEQQAEVLIEASALRQTLEQVGEAATQARAAAIQVTQAEHALDDQLAEVRRELAGYRALVEQLLEERAEWPLRRLRRLWLPEDLYRECFAAYETAMHDALAAAIKEQLTGQTPGRWFMRAWDREFRSILLRRRLFIGSTGAEHRRIIEALAEQRSRWIDVVSERPPRR